MRVAAVQFSPEFKNFNANLTTMWMLASEAADNGAELIVLPELSTTGYSFLSSAEISPFAEDIEGGKALSLKNMTQLCQERNVAIAWGLVEKSGSNLYNAQCMVVPEEGDVRVLKYRKRNPWGNDYIWSTPGDLSPPIVEWRGKRVGLLICRDIRNKTDDVDDLYEKGDADIVAFSSNFGDGAFPSVSWMEFARDTGSALVVSNRYGQEENNNFGEGGICIIEANGKVHCEGLLWSKPCIVYADL